MNQAKFSASNSTYPYNKINKIIKSISDTANFQQAFTHTSYCNENNLEKGRDSYEALEFLGDSILNSQTSLFIYRKYYSHYSEGQMSKLKQLMVKESTLAEVSKEIDLGKYLRLGAGEEKGGGRKKISILADVFESLVGALYLEKGTRTVERFLKLTLFVWIEGRENMVWDYKTKLQVHCQGQKNWVSYRKKNWERAKGKSWFVVEVWDKLGTFCEEGEGKNLQEAEQAAAAKVVKKLKLEE